ncbi:hypothetical protein AMD27_01835 [Acinetobacter sp. TGL-Y2]|uniref:hypothetical protein n=1 Tax=Acinetobacter sp. TGL-Y2 TaxID=1407071 RepID=UPI0007A68056|nr:hypothetical protein [Acinetobacter sp. TGL-Y2]AMW77754.1 hypothetical protein AMD27_01835 [Acinetobacter sp. TGL-Y2]
MNINKIALLSSALLISTPLFADTQTNSTTKTAPSYGDNPNLLKVLAVKTQEKVQSTAEKVGAATERGIAKIKPTVDNTWNGTKEYTSEQAVIMRDNTREGIDVAVQKVKKTKENILGSNAPNNVPIERGSLSQQANTVQQTNTAQQPTPQYITPAVAPTAVVQETPPVSPALNQDSPTTEAEIQRQSLPIQNTTQNSTTQNSQSSTSNDDADEGLPR